MKALIFDTGSLITLSMNGLLYLVERLKKNFDGKFLITREVKYEIIDKPIGIPRFELGALRVKNLLERNIISLPESVDISPNKIKKETERIMEIANHSVKSKGRWIKIVSPAEMSCLALSLKLLERGIKSLIVIDERTTRLISEKPENLQKLMSQKLHTEVIVFLNKLKEFSKLKFIRSTELVYVAYEKDLLEIKGKKALEAVLFATKFKGSSVSFNEIEILKKL